jgi:hypothetical protein
VKATALERLAIVVASLVVTVGLIALLSGFFASRDQAGVSAFPAGPGRAFPDQGRVHLKPGDVRPLYNSNPPTSGPHFPQPVSRDGAVLSDDQLLQALELGDVVIMYGGGAPPPGLEAEAGSLAPRFSPALAAAGQAVILARRPGTAAIIALAWTRLLRARSANDPQLKEFVQSWLGRGAGGQ